VKFDQLTKIKNKNFDQTPKLTENFDQLKMSSEIRSSDRFPFLRGLFKRVNLNVFSKESYLKLSHGVKTE